jgi:hypothetical protein
MGVSPWKLVYFKYFIYFQRRWRQTRFRKFMTDLAVYSRWCVGFLTQFLLSQPVRKLQKIQENKGENNPKTSSNGRYTNFQGLTPNLTPLNDRNGEQRFVEEEGDPFFGGGQLARDGVAQFVMGAGDPDQIGPAKASHDARPRFRFRCRMSINHAASMTEAHGQMLSITDKIF